MDELWRSSAAAIGRMIASKEVSAREVVEAALSRAAVVAPDLECLVATYAEEALCVADAADAELAVSGPRSPLHGVPFVAKDIVDVGGHVTGNGSAIPADGPAAEDAVVVAKLKAAGAILLAKAETHEFAIGGPDSALPYGPARNPWAAAHYPGGSSSGSGSATAAGIVPMSIGTDTGGSIRIPAAYCGLAGMKATYGRVSRRGVSPLAYSLDHVGPMTWTVEDNALMLAVMAGHDPMDPGSADVATADYAAAVGAGGRGLRVGLLRAFHEEQASVFSPEQIAGFEAAASALADAGATLSEVTLPPMTDYMACNRVLLLAEAYAVHEADFRTRPEVFGPFMRERLLAGFYFSAADYVQAVRRRAELVAITKAAMAELDVMLVVGAVLPAPLIEGQRPDSLLRGFPSVTAPFNVTGNPVLAVPSGFSSAGLPLSVQIVAKYFDEATAYRAGAIVEAALADRTRRPNLAAAQEPAA